MIKQLAHVMQIEQEISNTETMLNEHEQAGVLNDEYKEAKGYVLGLQRAIEILQVYGLAERKQ